MHYRSFLKVGDAVRSARQGSRWSTGVVLLIVPPRVCVRRECARRGVKGVERLRKGVLYDWQTYVVEADNGRRYHPPVSQIEVLR